MSAEMKWIVYGWSKISDFVWLKNYMNTINSHTSLISALSHFTLIK